ncbi:hypothetical protein, partial [Shewanella ulleungensis]|uniref:hypothetical protein n=1 Tax=Shewanella ulleungensis TaxID=2282699 RepID=UPI001E45F2A2
DNILAVSIKIDELITSFVTLAKAMKTSYVICSRNGWLRFLYGHELGHFDNNRSEASAEVYGKKFLKLYQGN